MIIPESFKTSYLIFIQNIKLVLKLVFLDQVSKWWLISFLQRKPGYSYNITSFFDLVYVWNYGISFGFFRNYYQYSNYFFIIINGFITSYIWYLLIRCKNSLAFIGYSFIIGGAVGNLIDRIYRGAVFDFIYLHYKQYGFSVFNLADSFITIGALCILKFYYDERKIAITKENAKNYLNLLEQEAQKIRDTKD